MPPNPYLSDLVNHAAKIHRALAGVVVLSAIVATAADARASEPSDGRGLAVIAEGSSMSPAWALARAVYADPALRPPALDEAQARVLAGGPVPADASRELRDLAETRAALHGDDAPSRSLLTTLVVALHVKGIVVVEEPDRAKPTARVFVTSARAFDAVVYESDPSAAVTWGTEEPPASWTGALPALHRGFADPTVIAPAIRSASAAAAQHGPMVVEKSGVAEKSGGGSKPFYTSPWFWGALAAAGFAAGAVYLVSRGSPDPTIQLQLQVPK